MSFLLQGAYNKGNDTPVGQMSPVEDFCNKVMMVLTDVLSKDERRSFDQNGGENIISGFISEFSGEVDEENPEIGEKLIQYIFKIRGEISKTLFQIVFKHKEQIVSRVSLILGDIDILNDSLTPIPREILHFLFKNKGKMVTVDDILDYVYQKDENIFNEAEPNPYHLSKYLCKLDKLLRKYGYSLIRIHGKGVILLQDGENGEGIDIGEGQSFFPEGNFICVSGSEYRYLLSKKSGELLMDLLRPMGKIVPNTKASSSNIKRLRENLKTISSGFETRVKNIYGVGYYFSDGGKTDIPTGPRRRSATIVGKKRTFFVRKKGTEESSGMRAIESVSTQIGAKKKSSTTPAQNKIGKRNTKKPAARQKTRKNNNKRESIFTEVFPGVQIGKNPRTLRVRGDMETACIKISKAQLEILEKITANLGIFISSGDYSPNIIQGFFKKIFPFLGQLGWTKVYIRGLGYKVIPSDYPNSTEGKKEFTGRILDNVLFSSQSRLLYNEKEKTYCTLGEKEGEILSKIQTRKKGTIKNTELPSRTIAHVLYNKLISFNPEFMLLLEIIPGVGIRFSLDGLFTSEQCTEKDGINIGQGLNFNSSRVISHGEKKVYLSGLELETFTAILATNGKIGCVKVQDKIVSYIRTKIRNTFGIDIACIHSVRGEGYYFDSSFSGGMLGEPVGVDFQPGLCYLQNRRAIISRETGERIHLTRNESDIFEDTFLRKKHDNGSKFCKSSRKRLSEKMQRIGCLETL